MRRRRGRSALSLGVVLALVAPAVAAPAPALESHDRALAAWRGRAEERRGAVPAREPVTRAIAAFEEALAADPVDVDVRLGLLEALYFLGEFVAVEREEKLATHRRAVEIGDRGIELAADGGGAAGLYFWTAVHWGLWGRVRGKLAAARQGVGGKIRDHSEKAIALDPAYEGGGGHRMLGRLHAEAPKIPLVTGWVDRQKAVAELETALAIAPARLDNRLYLAEALLDYVPERRHEALELLRGVAAAEPSPERLIEDLRTIEDARRRLEGADG